MKKLIFVILFLTLSFSILPESKIKFKQTKIDFGEIERGKIVNVKFKFENIGDSILIIKNIRTSCGCTAARFNKKEYKPGEKGEIPIKFFSEGRNGIVKQTITVSTNDKDNVYTRLTLYGKIILKNFATAEIDPDKIYLNEVFLNEKYEKIISIKNTGNISLRIIEVIHAPEISTEFSKKEIEPNSESEIKIVFKPMQTGKFITFLKIRTNAFKQPYVITRIQAEVSEDN